MDWGDGDDEVVRCDGGAGCVGGVRCVGCVGCVGCGEALEFYERNLLRLAVFEMLSEADTPSKVIINEAIELARSFSGDAAVGFVNGVLDAVRKELRRT